MMVRLAVLRRAGRGGWLPLRAVIAAGLSDAGWVARSGIRPTRP